MYIKDTFKVELAYEGEGFGGEYDPKDSEDSKLLRFTFYELTEDNLYEQVDDGSYCTNISDIHNVEVIQRVEELLMNIFISARKLNSYKRILSTLSWLSDEDVTALIPA